MTRYTGACAREQRSALDQCAVLDERLGEGVGATLERFRLLQIEELAKEGV